MNSELAWCAVTSWKAQLYNNGQQAYLIDVLYVSVRCTVLLLTYWQLEGRHEHPSSLWNVQVLGCENMWRCVEICNLWMWFFMITFENLYIIIDLNHKMWQKNFCVKWFHYRLAFWNVRKKSHFPWFSMAFSIPGGNYKSVELFQNHVLKCISHYATGVHAGGEKSQPFRRAIHQVFPRALPGQVFMAPVWFPNALFSYPLSATL